MMITIGIQIHIGIGTSHLHICICIGGRNAEVALVTEESLRQRPDDASQGASLSRAPTSEPYGYVMELFCANAQERRLVVRSLAELFLERQHDESHRIDLLLCALSFS